ncbi:protein of unknown function DUF29 [Gloeothece citriformis PCC 7424]|uniref:DUF29 domain-containing protein n=1 Tax=Gloeothece citriformis (strain PCC 7424) TaxID=65393 RepID=B7KDH6_GLOC7|nr:DUF29 domain-containing protein [Gloeothece citriformis]ACK68996.1 protein of unknown function DUF29 [Gloeothece citriformis PCC 7424]
MIKSLHDRDFYLWILEQTKLIERKDFEQVDWENLIEEIKDMGDNRYAKVSSWIIRIIQHKLKIDYVGDINCLKHWRKEIETFRVDVEGILTPQLKLN